MNLIQLMRESMGNLKLKRFSNSRCGFVAPDPIDQQAHLRPQLCQGTAGRNGQFFGLLGASMGPRRGEPAWATEAMLRRLGKASVCVTHGQLMADFELEVERATRSCP